MNKLRVLVEVHNPSKYNDAGVPGAPDSIVDPALSIMRALNAFEYGHYHRGMILYALHRIT